MMNSIVGKNALASIPHTSSELERVFNNFNQTSLSAKDYASQLGNADKRLKDYISTTEVGSASMGGFEKSLQKPVSTLGKIGKVVASTAINMGAYFAVEKVIDVGIKAWDNYANAQEKAIEKGNSAITKHQENLTTFSTGEKLIQESGARFVELGEGVDAFGNNISLTTEQFSEYNNLANEIASSFPSLISGYSSLGTPILTAADSVKQLNEALSEQKSLVNKENIGNAQNYTNKFNAEVTETSGKLAQESGLLEKRSELKALVDSYNKTGSVKSALKDAGYDPSGHLVQNKAIKQIADDLEIDVVDGIDFFGASSFSTDIIDENIDKFTSYLGTIDSQIETAIGDTTPLLQSYLEETPDYDSLKDDTKTALTKIISDMDETTFTDLFFDKSGKLDSSKLDSWSKDITGSIKSTGVQDNLKELFSLSEISDDMSFSDYENKVNTLSESLGKEIKGVSAQQLRSLSGTEAKLKDYSSLRDQIINDNKITTNKDLEQFSNGDLKMVLDIVAKDNTKLTISEIKNRLAELKKVAEDISDTKYFDEWQSAITTENTGSKYDQMISGMGTAKEARDKGLVGTDDFKSFAALISPTASDDVANFDENYEKFQRYFTSDTSTGLRNLAQDLSTVTDGAEGAGQKLAEFNGQTGQWDFNITDIDFAAQKLGMSSELLVAAFGKMNEYAGEFGSNNVIGSLTDGLSRSTALTSSLADEQARYNKLTSETDANAQGYSTSAGNHTFGNQTAIDASSEKLKQYREDLKETIDNTQTLIEKSGQSDEIKRKSAIEATKALAEQQKVAQEI